MKATALKVNYLTDPIDLDVSGGLKFFWKCEGGKKQTAYRIEVRKKDGTVMWDSKEVESGSMTQIKYAGAALRSRDEIAWKVTLRDENGQWGEEAEAHFEVALLDGIDWKCSMISGDYKPKKSARYPVDCFKKEFVAAAGKEIAKARLYATAHGIYGAAVNSRRIEDFILAPGMTDYRKRLQYQTYDVTALLQAGAKNTIELELADGWYRGSSNAFGTVANYGSQTAVMAQLEITYTDGGTDTIVTDDSWAWSNDGTIAFADLKDGEIVDLNRKPTYSGKAVASKGFRIPRASNNVYVKEKERFAGSVVSEKKPHDIGSESKYRTTYDFGQNVAGYPTFKLQGKKGQQVRIVCGEILDENRSVTLKNVQEKRPAAGYSTLGLTLYLVTRKDPKDMQMTPKQEIVLTLTGGVDEYKPKYTVFGFQYAEVISESAVEIMDMASIAVYSDMERTGDFHCSHEGVNQIFRNTVWSMKGNYLDIPTDCPTRERLGWTGDAQIFFNTGAYIYDTAAFFDKWIRDMEDAQYKNGYIPAVFPFEGGEMVYKNTGVSVGWADCIYLVPYRYYLRYHDLDLLKRCYPMMRKYTDQMIKTVGLKDKKAAKANPYNAYTLEKGTHLGEWLEPAEFNDVSSANATVPSQPEVATAYLSFTFATMAQIAELVGDEAYAKESRRIAEGARKAYIHLFVDRGSLNTKRYAKIVRPLALGLLDDSPEKKAQGYQALQKAVTDFDYKVGTGFLSTVFLLETLVNAGDPELAYKILENEQNPGWLFEVGQGATTIWEDWEGKASRNHYSPGAVCQWFFDGICGIKVDGENHFIIAPVPGGSLTEAEASYDSIYGKVISGWKRSAGKTLYTIEVPVNTTASVTIGEETTELEAGSYTFEQ